jgi:DNA-binding CsgD family transcriptional regulator
MSLGQAGDYAQALEWLGRAYAIMESVPHRESFARLQQTSGQILLQLLALTRAREHLESGLALARELGSGFLTLFAIARLATAAVLQNDLVRAKQLLDASLPAEYPEGRLSIHMRRLWGGRAELELAQDNPGRALEIVERLLASTVNLAQQGPHAVPYLSRLRALALAGLGQMEDAEAELQGTLPVASRQGQRSMLWPLHADLGQVYDAMGRRDEAEREFSSARTIIRDLANNVPEGALRVNFLKQAMATLPAAPTLTPRQSAKKEFGGLTARERQIAALIARGKSNREIAEELVISETTAERHVANILSKLGFNSRTQIALWAVEKGLGR